MRSPNYADLEPRILTRGSAHGCASRTVSEEQFAGCLLGLACGDALGATLEFLSRDEVRARYGQLREIVGGGWLRLAPGEVTDDTQMATCIAESIVATGTVDGGRHRPAVRGLAALGPDETSARRRAGR